MAYLLIPPVVMEGPAGGGPLFSRYKLPRGVSLLVGQDNSVISVRYPSEYQLADARVAYIGGHEYVIDDAEAQILTDAGYADCLYPWTGE